MVESKAFGERVPGGWVFKYLAYFVILSETKDLCFEEPMKQYYVYLMTNASGTLYTGIANNLEIRAWQHKSGATPGFTARYRIKRLIYFEMTNDVKAAIAREKKIKGWTRKKKMDLIKAMNPSLEDLSREWFEAKT